MYKIKISILLLIVISFFSCKNNNEDKNKKEPVKIVPKPIAKIFSYPKDDYIISYDTIREFDTFGKILNKYNLPNSKIYEITQIIKDSFDIKRIKLGKPYIVLSQKDTTDTLAQPKVFIYQNNLINYTIVDFHDSAKVVKFKKKVSVKPRTATVTITKSLYQDISDKDLSPKLAMELSDIYAWTVDFFHLNKGDEFRVIYDDVFIDDSVYTGIGNIHASLFQYGGKDFYAFRYAIDSLGKKIGYYDDMGRTLRKQFLKAPIKFGRVSSRYNPHRFIKYYGREKPHLGTDFAAPVGTPIMATANGIVIKRGYTSGNGNYIKIKHNATYSTQYLHMKGFAKGTKVGSVVTQGQVIGYIGMTGHTSGPHVCYRFWKNGRQVDALKEKMPPSKPIDSLLFDDFSKTITPIKARLDSL